MTTPQPGASAPSSQALVVGPAATVDFAKAAERLARATNLAPSEALALLQEAADALTASPPPEVAATLAEVAREHPLGAWREYPKEGRFSRFCACGHQVDARDVTGSHRAHVAEAQAAALAAAGLVVTDG